MRQYCSQQTYVTLCRNRRRFLPNYSAKPISNAPALADLESIPPPRRFGYNARLPQPFRPAFLESNFAAPAKKRCFSQIAFAAEKILACAQASPNLLEKERIKTRGFTSCHVFLHARRNVNVTNLFLCFRMRKH
jgi:hypothetical protein